MRFLAFAADYDGTLAQHGRVRDETLAALEKLRATGRKLILVTGRELDELLSIFPGAELFERIVAENGALIYEPASRSVRILSEGPPKAFIDALQKRKVTPLSLGHVIVATWKPNETAVLEAIRDLGLDLQVIFNKEAVMVLPANVNKATGLTEAIKELELSPHEVVGVGDAENDHAFLSLVECSVAVENALPSVKEKVDLVTQLDHGKGVEELIDQILLDDLKDLQQKLIRQKLSLGKNVTDEEFFLEPFGSNLLIAGPSGSGKSTISKSFIERIEEKKLQFCIVDPEGDYAGLEDALTIAVNNTEPSVDEILQLLKKPDANIVINLIGLPLADRPPFFASLLQRLQEMRMRTGRPHWIIVDETHHLLPVAWEPGLIALPKKIEQMVFITVHPDQVMSAALNAVSDVLAVGSQPEDTLSEFCKAVGDDFDLNLSKKPETRKETGEIVYWPRSKRLLPVTIRVALPVREHHRHVRKYAEGELPPEQCFYFKGAEDKLNLRVQNLLMFNQIAAGVDDETWLFHLRKGDYSRWFRDHIHDNELAKETEEIERSKDFSAQKSRESIKQSIERKYTLPVTTPFPMPGTQAASKRD